MNKITFALVFIFFTFQPNINCQTNYLSMLKDSSLYIVKFSGKIVIATITTVGVVDGIKYFYKKIDEYNHPENILERKIQLLKYAKQFHLDDNEFLVSCEAKIKEYSDEHKKIITEKHRLAPNTTTSQTIVKLPMIYVDNNDDQIGDFYESPS